MPVTSFHLSSASSEARANGSTVADFTLPLRPPMQIPATAQPTAYLPLGTVILANASRINTLRDDRSPHCT
eukprot:COSAG02_NODE_18901_length_911_cov_1.320197_1_plen_70_part_10